MKAGNRTTIQLRMKVALVTYAKAPELSEDDRPLLEHLSRQGVEAKAVAWDAAGVDWRDFDAVVLRSCWDYHLRPSEFREWVHRLQRAQVPLWNPAQLILWNMDKIYLRDLAAMGVTIVPTVWLQQGEPCRLEAILESNGWEEAVVKPGISASATGTWRVSRERAASKQAALERLLSASGVLVQKYMEEVATTGEWSIIFINGEYSHSVLKQPGRGDFRVQSEFGGSTLLREPSPAILQQAEQIMRKIESPYLYSRVDGMESGGEFVLMELELIEPYLFLGYSPRAAQRLAEAIVSVLHD